MVHLHEIGWRISMKSDTNDVIANIGVIIAGILVHFFKSQLPDLIIGLIIAVIVLRGAFTIIKLARSTKLKPES